jgi:hypothetical protein
MANSGACGYQRFISGKLSLPGNATAPSSIGVANAGRVCAQERLGKAVAQRESQPAGLLTIRRRKSRQSPNIVYARSVRTVLIAFAAP